ncbi:hypothetical protein WJX72_007460 [[Myrmecia] bisecta]|uniref:J domain-containing protein n=1 Tax=[Myrmecia] bisecta TaxID=41462 RepID=A0AAW1R7I1_9CHLO
MATAAVDVLGFLPGPASKNNAGAADMLAGEAFAYAVSSAVAVVDVHRMQLACVLQGGHKSAAVTAVSWCPECHTRDLKGPSHLRLASGDQEGRVVVWDVTSANVIATLDDPHQAATGAGRKADKPAGIKDLAWVMSSPCLLGILMASGLFVVWDTRGGGVVWKKDFGAEQLLASIKVNPTDMRHICLCGQKGSIVVLRLVNMARDKVEQQTYKVDMTNSKANDTLRCCFSTTRDLLYVMLPREVVVFDLEFGQPAASTTLQSARPAFRDILGCFGHTDVGRGVAEGGVDLLYCSHQDGSLSIWRRQPSQLSYTLLHISKLVPPPSRINNNAVLSLLCISAAVWVRCNTDANRSTVLPRAGHTTQAFGINGKLAGKAGGQGLLTAQNQNAQSGWEGDWEDFSPIPSPSKAQPAGAPGAAASPVTTYTSAANASASLIDFDSPVVAAPAAALASSHPNAAASAGTAATMAVIAAVTSAGNVELVTLQRGALTPLMGTISVSLGAHKDIVRGVRWLGPTARIVSFSSEKTQHGFRNTLLLTDIRNRSSLPFRELGAENAPMLGIRASPSGRYILVLLRGAPSEIWAIGGSTRPLRVRVLDLPFTAVEWVLPSELQHSDPMAPAKWLVWERSPLAKERSLYGYWDDDGENTPSAPTEAEAMADAPEERLAFALGDGRVGVLAVKGRKVTDTKPKRPMWGLLAGAESVATAIASWGNLVILGDADGNLNRWDTATGRITTISTGQGAARRIHFAPPACEQLFPNQGVGSATTARVSVMFANGTFGVWELDGRNELKQGPVSVTASTRVGRVIDMSWAPLPHPVGAGSVLTVAIDDGSLAFIDASQTLEQNSRKQRLQAFKHLVGGNWPYPQGVLSPPPALGSSLLLPRAWALLLRLLLQQAVPLATLKALCTPLCEGDETLEEAVWGLLPRACRSEWDSSPHRMYSTEATELSYIASGGTIRRMRKTTGEAPVLLDLPTIPAEDDGQFQLSPKSASLEPQLIGASPSAAMEPQLPPVRTRSLSGDGGADGSVFVRGEGSKKFSMNMKDRFNKITGRSAVRSTAAEDDKPDDADGAAAQPVDLRSRHTYTATLVMVLKALAKMRAGGALLHAAEWRAYTTALDAKSTAARMAVAAAIMGCSEEARFWRGLPATLEAVKSRAMPSKKDLETALSAALSPSPGQPGASNAAELAPSAVGRLWTEAGEIAEARERAQWHEQMSRRNIEHSEKLQERRVIEYVVLGDFQTAVGFLLASTPERSARYYRDALCTLALAAASPERYNGPAAAGGAEAVSRTLHIQAAKVVTAHAATVGDNLLGVPLLCSAGLPQEAVALLQEAGLWKYASTLAANTLTGGDQAAALERWAAHIHQSEGSLWRAMGIMAAAGALRSAVLMLRKLGMADSAMAFAQACAEAGLYNPAASPDGGHLDNLFHHTGNTPLRQRSFAERAADSQGRLDSVNFVALQGSLARDDLWRETTLFERLLYKNHNQHRTAKHYHKLAEVRRLLRLLRSLQLSQLIGELHGLTRRAHGVGLTHATASYPAYDRDLHMAVPSGQAAVLVLQRLLAACRIVEALLPAIHGAAGQLLAQLAMSYFMPFSLTATAMLARILATSAQVLLDASKAYNSLVELVPALPFGPLAGANVAGLDALPMMVKCDWKNALPQYTPVECSQKGPASCPPSPCLRTGGAVLHPAQCVYASVRKAVSLSYFPGRLGNHGTRAWRTPLRPPSDTFFIKDQIKQLGFWYRANVCWYKEDATKHDLKALYEVLQAYVPPPIQTFRWNRFEVEVKGHPTPEGFYPEVRVLLHNNGTGTFHIKDTLKERGFWYREGHSWYHIRMTYADLMALKALIRSFDWDTLEHDPEAGLAPPTPPQQAPPHAADGGAGPGTQPNKEPQQAATSGQRAAEEERQRQQARQEAEAARARQRAANRLFREAQEAAAVRAAAAAAATSQAHAQQEALAFAQAKPLDFDQASILSLKIYLRQAGHEAPLRGFERPDLVRLAKQLQPEWQARRVLACKKVPPSVSARLRNLLILQADGAANCKRAYNRVALAVHPDKNASQHAAEAFKLVNEAYLALQRGQHADAL